MTVKNACATPRKGNVRIRDSRRSAINRLGACLRTLVTVVLAMEALAGCKQAQKEAIKSAQVDTMNYSIRKAKVPEWHKNATIYEVNLRIYTSEGTFRAFQKHIPRLKQMGVDILWFMPLYPVSQKNRKGKLGSPYAVADYLTVNPDFGSMEDFKDLVRSIHDAGMHCIIDWVPNHTGWDHTWITAHPDWYTKDSQGNITDPINPATGEPWGWTDVADLDFQNKQMRLAMIDAMAFWVQETGVDGFRVDVAHGVPVDFWVQCTDALYALKPLFMLSEGEVPEIVNNGSFIMDYAWEMNKVLAGIAETQGVAKAQELDKGNLVDPSEKVPQHVDALDIDRQLARQKHDYQQGYKMQFTSNHDENAWAGTEFQRFGEGHKAFAVLTATFDGMPLVYSGQESAVDRQYAFFEEDEIPWGAYEYAGFYETLFNLKHGNKALWNGESGGPLVKIETSDDHAIYAFMREKDGDRVVVIINLSSGKRDFELKGNAFAGSYTDIFDLRTKKLLANMEMVLPPWGFLVLAR